MRLLLVLLATVNIAWAQDYPSRPVTVIVPFSAGSASDVIARILLERMNASIGQRFIVDNRPAAGGAIGTAGQRDFPLRAVGAARGEGVGVR